MIITALSEANNQELWKMQTQIHISWLIIIQYSLQKTNARIMLIYILGWLGTPIFACCSYFTLQIRIKDSLQQKESIERCVIV